MEGMEVEDDEDTCEMVVENGFVGGHSTFDICFSGRMNLQLRFDEALYPPKRPSLCVHRPQSGSNRRPWLPYLPGKQPRALIPLDATEMERASLQLAISFLVGSVMDASNVFGFSPQKILNPSLALFL
ncbi:hypothetical protein Ddye_014222 [Dipteronia dyeriana]|uniref:Uncharacterized protein n=1 Tax=Dipteronia dyeriana TaxID=168575 RepID=A0AAD9X801_9ROSI|nr:hypothetical protein Ddye_014222 [Dipteronia dyeriana]